MAELVEQRRLDGKRPTVELIEALQAENEQLRAALVVEQAKGAMSARLGVTPEVAFELLRGLSNAQGRTLHDFAAEVLANQGRLHGDIVGVWGNTL
jgi:AmiR/NasT family two-component response regulator